MVLKSLFVVLNFTIISIIKCSNENILLICNRNNTPNGYNIESNKNFKNYYSCDTNKLPVLKECPNSLLFNRNTGFCDRLNFNLKNNNKINVINKSDCQVNLAANFIIVPNQYNTGSNNDLFQNEYLKCVNGELIKFLCPHNLIFNNRTGFCDRNNIAIGANNNFCQHNTVNIPKNYSISFNNHSTNKYFHCTNNGLLYTTECNRYNYNANTGFCDLNISNSSNASTKTNYKNCTKFNLNHTDTIYDPESCKHFFQCVNGEMISKMCFNNLIFDPVRKDCLTVSDRGKFCTNIMTGMCKNVPRKYQIFDGDRESNEFIECDDEYDPKRKTCGVNLFFNSNTGFCDLLSNIDFETNLLDVHGNFDELPEFDKMNELIRESAVMEILSTTEHSVEIIRSCKGQQNGVTFQLDPSKCDQYVMCEYGMTHNITCPSGLSYSRSFGSCDFIETNECAAKQNLTLCQYYPDGYFIKRTDSCSDYYYCDFGELIHRKCPDDFVFNPKISSCDWKENYECFNSAESEGMNESGGGRIGKSMTDNNLNGTSTDCIVSDLCPNGLYYNRITSVCDFC